MKRDGYQVVCELFGFGKTDPKPTLAFASDWIDSNGDKIIKYYEKDSKNRLSFRLVEEDDFVHIKDIIKKMGKDIGKAVKGDFDYHLYAGLVIGLYYNSDRKRYDHFSFWIVDPEAGEIQGVIIKISYKGGSNKVQSLSDESGRLHNTQLSQKI